MPSVSDMPQIYVHIGLPKTATTTLQTQAFQHHEGWAYLGTRTPRMLNADPTFKVLEAYVQRGEGALSGVQEALASRLEREGKPLMVRAKSTPWQAQPFELEVQSLRIRQGR
ncbi:MAG: hypothetical protein ACPIA5_00405 [Flavobacteriales bacterium]